MKKEILVSGNYYITVEQKNWIEKIANRNEVSGSKVVRDLIEEKIKSFK